jgi:hypothetical protein
VKNGLIVDLNPIGAVEGNAIVFLLYPTLAQMVVISGVCCTPAFGRRKEQVEPGLRWASHAVLVTVASQGRLVPAYSSATSGNDAKISHTCIFWLRRCRFSPEVRSRLLIRALHATTHKLRHSYVTGVE